MSAIAPPTVPLKMPGKPPVPVKLPQLIKPASTNASAVPTKPAKVFTIESWSDADEGEKIILYGKSGMGKTTLASMAPNAVFIGLDDGGRKIYHPVTGELIKRIPGVTTFSDVRDALHQANLWPEKATIVIDTMTKLEAITEEHIIGTYKKSGGASAKTMRDFGWDGPAHNLDCTRLLLSDLDAHVRVGRNVILLCQLAQIRVANAEGFDYLEDGPKLQHNNQYSTRTEVCEWADHVLRIGYQEMQVVKEDTKAKAGKVTSTDSAHVIYSGGAQHFMAKSRPVKGHRIPTAVTFGQPSDNAIWSFIFDGAIAQET